MSGSQPGFIFKDKPSEHQADPVKLQQLQGDTESDPVDTVEVLCINCLEFVSTTDIEVHSRACLTVKEEVLKLETLSPLDGLRVRCSKLFDYLFSKSEAELPGDKNYLMILQRLCSNINGVRGFVDEAVTKDVIAALNSIINYSQGSNVVLIYAERVKALASEQLWILEELRFDEAKEQITTLRTQVEFFKQRTQQLQKALVAQNYEDGGTAPKTFMDEVKSDIGSKLSQRLGSLSGASSDLGNMDMSLGDVMQQESESDNLKKYFYSHCLAIKLQYADQTLANEVPISWMYNKAVTDKVPANEWPVFIRNQIELASKSTAAGQKADPPRSIRRRFKYFETSAE
jgi:hypothetical protein